MSYATYYCEGGIFAMPTDTLSLIHYAWSAIGVVWILGLVTTKRTVRAEPAAARLFHLALVLSGMYLLAGGSLHSSWLDARILPRSQVLDIVGLTFTFGGCLFAIWARIVLGSNWSGRVTVKEGHELTIAGPYAIVRHPMYTGLLLAALGTGITIGEARCILGFAMLVLAFIAKIGQEEQLMLEIFPQAYPPYRLRVKALIPGVF
jgi:protein-S-isoprenylcysteine O-methyltransferase Ste14